MNGSKFWLFPLFLGFIVLALQCSCNKDSMEDAPNEKLSDYSFFVGSLANLSPADRVLPYDLNTPLFSDYAGKSRFIWMPEGVSATYDGEGVPEFPEGAIIIKTFYFDNDLNDPSQGRRILETRLLIKTATSWAPATYIWNEAQTEANFSLVGGQVDVSWKHSDGNMRSTNYYIPNKNDCKGCHNTDNQLVPIGPAARNLNKDFQYTEGTMNQLEKWTAVGYLTDLPTLSSVERLPTWDDDDNYSLDERARAYLDVNCAHCHNTGSPADNSGLFLHYNGEDAKRLGICKDPVAAGRAAGDRHFVIVPGLPDESIMEFRMNSNEPDIAMPELARSTIHDEGLDLIRQWIAAMPTVPDNCN